MDYGLCDRILSLGKNTALQKLLEDNEYKDVDIRTRGYMDLQKILEKKAISLFNTIADLTFNAKSPSIEDLTAICEKAGEALAFASIIISKAHQDISRLNPQPALWDEWDRAKSFEETTSERTSTSS